MRKLVLADMTSFAHTIINHPAEVVWPHLLNQAAWMKDLMIESVTGQPNAVGEVRKVLPAGADPKQYELDEIQPFFFQTLLLSPLRKFVYKAYTRHRGGEYGFTGIEILTLNDLIQQTAVSLEVYLEWESGTMSEGDLAALVAKAKEGAAAMWERNFQRLNVLVNTAVPG
jgi:hypothetical protein